MIRFRLGKIVSDMLPNLDDIGSDTKTFRVNVQALDNYYIYIAMVVPSKYRWEMPEINSLVIFADDGTNLKRVVLVLGDLDRNIDKIKAEGEVTPGESQMAMGDVFVGKYGRAYFFKNGDVRIGALHNRSELYFEEDTGLARLNGYDFNIHTKSSGIEMLTIPSTSGIEGDQLAIRRNADDGLNLSQVFMYNDGAIDLGSGQYGDTFHSLVSLDPLGNMSHINDNCGLVMESDGHINIFAGLSTFSGSPTSISFNPDGSASLLAISSIDVSSDTNVDISAPQVNIMASTGLVVTGPTTVTGSSTITGATTITGTASIVGPLSVSGPVATGPMTVAGPAVFSGSLSLAGAFSVAGVATFAGAISFLGGVSFVGVPVIPPVPLAGLSYRATMPVLINGLPYVIPCL